MNSSSLALLTASIRNSLHYPENLIHKRTYAEALKKLRHRFDDLASDLCMSRDEDVNVPFRDLFQHEIRKTRQCSSNFLSTDSTSGFEKFKAQSEDDTLSRLGEISKGQPPPTTLRPDPKCRFMCVMIPFNFQPHPP